MSRTESPTQGRTATVAKGDAAGSDAAREPRREWTIRTAFEPSLYGWRLANRFRWGPRGRWTYGLCGGLCYAALDHWAQGRPVPPAYDPARLRSRTLGYLRRRQAASMDLRHLCKLARWLLMSDATVAQKVFAEVVPELQAVLEEGRPVPLMLVRTRGLARPWNNHQVVAYGCSCDAVTGTMRLQVYDPNHVEQPVEITLDPTGGDGAPRLAQSTGEPLRGLFPLRYRPAPPPSI